MFKTETRVGYALALLDIAKEEKKEKEFYKQSNLLILILENEEKFIEMLDNFGLSDKEKTEIVCQTFKGFDSAFINSMAILSIKYQLCHFVEILNELNKYLQDILKIKEGTIYSTFLLTDSKVKELEKKVSKELNCEVHLKNLIDKELIGGFKIIIGSTVIEDSIKSELNALKETLKINKGGV